MLIKLYSFRDTVGVTLLKKMGWRPGQGIGPRVTKREKTRTRRNNEKMKIYGCSLPNEHEKSAESGSSDSEEDSSTILFAPDDYEPFLCNPKDNYFGIGYSGLDRRPVLSGHVNLFDTPAFNVQEKSKKLSIRGQAFGVGAFEVDDEDIYQRDDMSRYDFALGPDSKSKSRWSKNEPETSRDNCLEGFQSAKAAKLERKKIFEPPELPRDFKPIHAVRKSRFYPPIENVDRASDDGRRKGLGRHDLDARSRAVILGDSPTPILQSEKSSPSDPKGSQVASNIITRTLNLHGKERTEERRLQESRLSTNAAGAAATWLEKLNAQSFVKGGVEGSDPGVEGSLKKLEDFRSAVAEETSSRRCAKPFVTDPEKQKRFEKFIELSDKGEKEKLSGLQPLSMTEWEREHEREEFEQASRLFERSSGSEEASKSEYLKRYGDGSSSMGEKFVVTGAEEAAPSVAKTLDDRMKDAARMKLFGKLTRQRDLWQPASLVCKRFNIPEPRTGCAKPESQTKNKRFSVFDSLEFGGSNERFERATDTAGTFKEPHIAYKPPERSVIDERTTSVGGKSRTIDTSDIDSSSSRSTEKMRSFEASYEKVFGRGNPPTASGSAMIDADMTNQRETRENSNFAEAKSPAVAEANSVEKKDLFKAIFLSSSEDSETENDEDDSEAVKSLLIGKTPGELNLQRNTSPPRGIFAKLDLDSLTKPGAKDERSTEGNLKESEKLSENKVADLSPERVDVTVPEVVLPPDMYGPVLPTRPARNDEVTSSVDPAIQKPIFKSVVVPMTDAVELDRAKGKWVERTKAKKSKKEKHKHKHKEKERSRRKHKSKKDKR